jgi:hypothetical protein
VNKTENVLRVMEPPSDKRDFFPAPADLHSPFAWARECGRLFASEKEIPVTQITVDEPTIVKPEDS